MRTAAKALLILGAVVGAAAGLGFALGLSLADLPPWMITVGMYKLAFLAAAGLFAAGALLGRAARGAGARGEAADERDVRRPALGPGAWEGTERPLPPAEHVNREHRER